jgi:hypothetical protein
MLPDSLFAIGNWLFEPAGGYLAPKPTSRAQPLRTEARNGSHSKPQRGDMSIAHDVQDRRKPRRGDMVPRGVRHAAPNGA